MGSHSADPAGATPLLLLPGMLGSRAYWSPVCELLRTNVNVTIGDITTADSVGAMAAAVLSHAPCRFWLAGFSLGGHVAIEIWRQDPSRILGMALLGTSAMPTPVEAQQRFRCLIGDLADGHFEAVLERDLLVGMSASSAAPGVNDCVLQMARQVGPTGLTRQLSAQIARPDSRPDLKHLPAGSAVIAGAQDTQCPLSACITAAKAIPSASLTVVQDSGHTTALERPEVVALALDNWLQGGTGTHNQACSN